MAQVPYCLDVCLLTGQLHTLCHHQHHDRHNHLFSAAFTPATVLIHCYGCCMHCSWCLTELSRWRKTPGSLHEECSALRSYSFSFSLAATLLIREDFSVNLCVIKTSFCASAIVRTVLGVLCFWDIICVCACMCDWSVWSQCLMNRLNELCQICNFGALATQRL